MKKHIIFTTFFSLGYLHATTCVEVSNEGNNSQINKRRSKSCDNNAYMKIRGNLAENNLISFDDKDDTKSTADKSGYTKDDTKSTADKSGYTKSTADESGGYTKDDTKSSGILTKSVLFEEYAESFKKQKPLEMELRNYDPDMYDKFANVKKESIVGQLFEPKPKNDLVFKEICDTGRLSVIVYSLCEAAAELIKQSKHFKDMEHSWNQTKSIFKKAINSKNIKPQQVAENISSVFNQKDIEDMMIGLYADLTPDTYAQDLEKNSTMESIRNFVQNEFKSLGGTFLEKISTQYKENRDIIQQNNDKYNDITSRKQVVEELKEYSEITKTSIKNGYNLCKRVVKNSIDYVLNLWSSKKKKDSLSHYKDSDGKSVILLGESNRTDKDDHLSSVFLYNEDKNTIDVNCIGTSNLRDWIYNFNFLKRKMSEKSILGYGKKYHAGFATLASEIYNNFEKNSDIQDLIAKGAKIRVSGHSLGGAVGQLLATELHQKYKDKVSLITFNQPAAVDADQAKNLTNPFQGNYIRIFNPRDLVPLALNNLGGDYLKGLGMSKDLWYRQCGIPIAAWEETLEKLENVFNPLSAHSLKNLVQSLPKTLENFVSETKSFYNQVKTIESKKNLFLNLKNYMSVIKLDGNKYNFEFKSGSKNLELRKQETQEDLYFKLKLLAVKPKYIHSEEYKNNVEKIVSLATAALRQPPEWDVIKKNEGVGQFVRGVLQTINSYYSKKNPDTKNTYLDYRHKVVETLKSRLGDYSKDSAQEAIISIAHLYDRDLTNLKVAFQNNKDTESFEKARSKIKFLQKELEKIEKTLIDHKEELQNISISQYGISDESIQKIQRVHDKVKNSIKTIVQRTYQKFNDAFSDFTNKEVDSGAQSFSFWSKTSTAPRRPNSMTLARELLALGLELNGRHWGILGGTRTAMWLGNNDSIGKNRIPQESLKKLMGSYGYNDNQIEKEIKKLNEKIEENNRRLENDDMEGISDTEEEN